MRAHEAIVVGGGLAGLRAAIELNRHNVRAAVLSRTHPLRSHSVAAQGGINAPLGNHPRGGHDSPERHAADTVKGSDYLADQDSVLTMTRQASERIYEMEHWGCPFSRTPEGKIAQRPFGGGAFPRTCYASDKTGQMLLHTLYQQALRFKHEAEREELVFYDEWAVLSLIVHDGRCCGVVGLDLVTGELEALSAQAVILATGGAGRIYGNSTNALINSGFGMAVAYWAGVPLKDMEFIQFHPTTLFGSNILMTEGCRGEGGYLLNAFGERFLANYEDSRRMMEVAPRDIVSRNMAREIQAGRGVKNAYLYLDLRHLGAEKINSRLPGIREICLNFASVDPIDDLIPVQPGQHYTMGGIDVDSTSRSSLPGLYAAGECACISVHGANRLGGNSLLETLSFGAIAGEMAAQDLLGQGPPSQDGKIERAGVEALKKMEGKIQGLMGSHSDQGIGDIEEELGALLVEKCGIFREERTLKEALEQVRKLKGCLKMVGLRSGGRRFNPELLGALELEGKLDLAEVIVAGALARQESRGAHYRTDFPRRDDKAWLQHTLAYYHEDGKSCRLSSSPVNLEHFGLEERKY